MGHFKIHNNEIVELLITLDDSSTVIYHTGPTGRTDTVNTNTLKDMTLWPRSCCNCGRGMCDGYVIELTGESFCDSEECTEHVHTLISEAGYHGENDWEDAYEEDFYYSTTWDDGDDEYIGTEDGSKVIANPGVCKDTGIYMLLRDYNYDYDDLNQMDNESLSKLVMDGNCALVGIHVLSENSFFEFANMCMGYDGYFTLDSEQFESIQSIITTK